MVITVCANYIAIVSLYYFLGFAGGTGTSKSSSSMLASKPGSSSNEDNSDSDVDALEPGPSNKQHISELTSAKKRTKLRSTTSKKKYSNKWENECSWPKYD